jgi:hypothetical protein
MQVLSGEQKGPIQTAWRKTCAHVSGGALGSTASVLERHGALAELGAASRPLLVAELADATHLQPAYAQLAAQLLATQGLARCARLGSVDATIELTDDGRIWVQHAAAYDDFELVLDDALRLRAAVAGTGSVPDVRLVGASSRARQALGDAPAALAERLRRHLRGPPVAVALRGLAEARAFGRIARAPLGWCPLDVLPLPPAARDACVALLAEESWLARDGDLVHVTPEGLAAARWMALYGYLVGYLGVLRQVPALLGNDGAAAADPTTVKGDADRTLLLAGKAQVFARGGLREPMQDLVRTVFDATPLDAQPRVLLDMSVGDGSVLASLHQLIVHDTARGRALAEHPLLLVGLASSALARERAADHLARAGIGCLLLEQGIEDPDAIARELARAGFDLHHALVISKTCIHGRRLRDAAGIFLPAADTIARPAVFVTPEGTLVEPAQLEDELAAFFARWAPWLQRHGMIAADTHGVPAEVAAESWPVNVVTHVAATHGYSAQYLVEAGVFRRAARRGGFTSRVAHDLGTALIGATTMTLDHLVVMDAARA